MSIIHTITAPNGAPCGYFRVMGFEFRPRDSDQLKVQVGGWVAEADAVGGALPVFNWYVELNPAALNVAQPIQSLEAALTTVADSPWLGGTVVPASTPLEEAKVRRWALIKQQREERDNSPIPHNGFEVDADASSRLDILGAITAMQLGGATSRLWRCTDNVMRELTLADISAIGQAIAARRQALIEASAAFYHAIQAAQTVAQLEVISWPVTP
jgi:hypothetical protein